MALTPEEEKKLREEIRKKLAEKEKKLREAKNREEFERQKKIEERIRAKIREEEEEKFYTEKGYVKYINRHGEVEWITPEEAERRGNRRRTRKASSRRIRHRRKRILRIALNLGLIGVAFFIFVFMYKFYPLNKSKPQLGALVVVSNVAGARIYLDGNELNRFAPDTLTNLSPGTHYVSLYREGFSVWPPVQRLRIKGNKTSQVSFELKNSLIQEKLIIQTNLSDFQLFVDGLPRPLDGSNWVNLPVGYHVISVVKPGYISIPMARRLVIEKGRSNQASFEFKKSEDIGSLQISANGSQGYIYVDNQFTGIRAGGYPIFLPSGVYQVKVCENGFQSSPENKIVNLLPGEKKILVFRMKPLKQRVPLKILTRTPGSSIILDGKLLPFVTPAFQLELSPGRHFLNFYREGKLFSELDNPIEVSENKKKDFYYEF